MTEVITKNLGQGIVNIPSDPELIPQQASQDSLGWISTDGQIELTKGRLLIGAEETASTSVLGHGFGYTATGTKIQFRKQSTKIQYYNETTMLWVDVVTGLTEDAEYTFSPYQSLAGTFIYVTGVDGIYKIHTANPGSYCSMYDSTKNYKGYSMITQSRMSMWNVKGSLTTHFMSYTDSAQDTTVYTSVAAEALTDVASGTLTFKAGDAKRTCFNVRITDTSSGETFVDNYDGTMTGSLGSTGTINYTTGAYTITGQSGAGTVDYSWEMTNNKGVTDFTYSGTRTALQGDAVRQDEGGDAIKNIIFYNGTYYSFKEKSVYSLTWSNDGLSFENIVFRTNIGLPYWRSVVATSKGIIFIDNANEDKPQLTILQQNITGDKLEPVSLAKHFNLADYTWDNTSLNTFGEFVVFSGKSYGSSINNRMFMYNVRRDTVDILPYGATTINSSEGKLYIGDTLAGNIYEILTGFDDDNELIENYWISNSEKYGSESLKKFSRVRLKGLITLDQILEVYVSYDNDTHTLVGTILGNGSYVDTSTVYGIGTQGIGSSIIGGEESSINGSFYFAQLKLTGPKFRTRSIKLKATGIGYVSVNLIDDLKIVRFQDRLPSKYRTKQNVSLDGTVTNM